MDHSPEDCSPCREYVRTEGASYEVLAEGAEPWYARCGLSQAHQRNLDVLRGQT